jgi:hypothetical protein
LVIYSILQLLHKFDKVKVENYEEVIVWKWFAFRNLLFLNELHINNTYNLILSFEWGNRNP